LPFLAFSGNKGTLIVKAEAMKKNTGAGGYYFNDRL